MGKETMPFGIGGRAFNELPAETKESRVPVAEVDNRVSWANKDMVLPFDLRVGKRMDLGVFFSPEPTGKSLRVHGAHQRSALIGRVIFKDKQGNFYRDLDAKGVGYIYRDNSAAEDEESQPASKNFIVDAEALTKLESGEKVSETGPWGFCLRDYALRDRYMSEKFIAAGIRTYRVAAIINLREMVKNDGSKISIKEAKRLNILGEKDEPVIELRAYTTRMRIINLAEEVHFRDALAIVATELGKENIDKTEYADWFAETLGEQLARMHKSGYIHGYIQYHNVTADCRIVDLDSVFSKDEILPAEFAHQVKKDVDGGKDILSFIADCINRRGGDEGLLRQLEEKYHRAYQDELSSNP